MGIVYRVSVDNTATSTSTTLSPAELLQADTRGKYLKTLTLLPQPDYQLVSYKVMPRYRVCCLNLIFIHMLLGLFRVNEAHGQFVFG